MTNSYESVNLELGLMRRREGFERFDRGLIVYPEMFEKIRRVLPLLLHETVGCKVKRKMDLEVYIKVSSHVLDEIHERA
jgi:hypothetical protein